MNVCVDTKGYEEVKKQSCFLNWGDIINMI